jgi:hypothetical protein
MNNDDGQLIPEGFKTLKNGPPAEQWVGPFYYRKDGQGLTLGFRADSVINKSPVGLL